MSLHKRRIQAIQAIVASTPAIALEPKHWIIQGEFNEVHRVRKVPQAARRRLLEVLHSSRALDTALSVFVAHHKCSNKRPTLGSYLVSLMRTPSLDSSTFRSLNRGDTRPPSWMCATHTSTRLAGSRLKMPKCRPWLAKCTP
jgi:hypothetical protein